MFWKEKLGTNRWKLKVGQHEGLFFFLPEIELGILHPSIQNSLKSINSQLSKKKLHPVIWQA